MFINIFFAAGFDSELAIFFAEVKTYNKRHKAANLN